VLYQSITEEDKSKDGGGMVIKNAVCTKGKENKVIKENNINSEEFIWVTILYTLNFKL
jgi:hypothetical protein